MSPFLRIWCTTRLYDFSREQMDKPQSLNLNLWLYNSVADSDNLPGKLYCSLFPSCLKSPLSYQYILAALKFLRPASGRVQTKTCIHTVISPFIHLCNFCFGTKENNFQRVISIWHFQDFSSVPKKSEYTWSWLVLSAGLIFSVATSFISWFLLESIAWRTLAWKCFTWFYEEYLCITRKSSLIHWP